MHHFTRPIVVRSRSRRALSGVVLVAALVLAGCGDDTGSTAGADVDDASVPTEVEVESTLPAEELPATDDSASDLPPELRTEVLPTEVEGTPLPELLNEIDDAAVGLPAPIVVGTDFDGSEVVIDGATNGPTMVIFVAHWCPHCNAEIPRINELRDEEAFPSDLDIVGVSTAVQLNGEHFPPSEWRTELDWTYPMMGDGVDLVAQTFLATSAYGVNSFPFGVIIDADGNVAKRWSGEKTKDELLAIIDQALA